MHRNEDSNESGDEEEDLGPPQGEEEEAGAKQMSREGPERTEGRDEMRKRMLQAMEKRGIASQQGNIEATGGEGGPTGAGKRPEDDNERQQLVAIIVREIKRDRGGESKQLECMRDLREMLTEARDEGRSLTLRDDRLAKSVEVVNGGRKLLSHFFKVQVKDFERQWVCTATRPSLDKGISVLDKSIAETESAMRAQEYEKQWEKGKERDRKERIHNQIVGDKKERRLNSQEE